MRDWVKLLRDEELPVFVSETLPASLSAESVNELASLGAVSETLPASLSAESVNELAKRLLLDISQEITHRRSKALGHNCQKHLTKGL